jgi:hypothetical protein
MPKTLAKRVTKTNRWSADVTKHSHALGRKPDVFKGNSPKKIAASLRQSAKENHHWKSEPCRSVMSMLGFYIHRAGRNLPQCRKQILEGAKDELRREFGKP